MIILVSLIFISIAAGELPYLTRNKMWRELAAFMGLLIIGMIYSGGFVSERNLPTTLDLMEMVFMPVTQYIEQLLS